MLSLRIGADGDVSYVYADQLRELFSMGLVSIKRLSHVEPDKSGQWVADMAPVGGPILGPFDLRSEALEAELSWIDKNLFGGKA